MAEVTVPAFIAKWSASRRTERAAAQEHFIDLCRLLGEQTPNEADPTGEDYAFEKGAAKTCGRPGLGGRVEAGAVRLGIQGQAREFAGGL